MSEEDLLYSFMCMWGAVLVVGCWMVVDTACLLQCYKCVQSW